MTEYHGPAARDVILHTLQTMQGQLTRIETRLESLVPRAEYEAWKATAAADHARIEAGANRNSATIEQLDRRVQAAERERNSWARDVNLKVWLAILGAGLSIAIGFIVRAF